MQIHRVAGATGPVGAIILLLTLGPAVAQQVHVDRLEVIASGFYYAEPTGQKTPAPATAIGAVDTIDKAGFLPTPPAVTAKVGRAFGVQFRTVGQPNNAKVRLKSVWQIPAPGMTNPDTGNVYRQNIVEFTAMTGAVAVRGYSFDKPWEVVPGQWTLQIWQGDDKLLERSFMIK